MDPNFKSWELIGIVLERVIKNMEITQYNSTPPNCFNSMHAPTISMRSYLHRIHLYANCSDSCYILAFIYLDRLLQNNPGFVLSNRNVHRLILSAVVLAIKYLEDYYADNLTYAKIGGVSLTEMNRLETAMLRLLHYNLHIDNKIYFQYVNELELQRQKIMEEEMDWSEEYVKPTKEILSLETFCSEMSYE